MKETFITYDNTAEPDAPVADTFEESEFTERDICKFIVTAANTFTDNPHKDRLNNFLKSLYCAPCFSAKFEACEITNYHSGSTLFPYHETTATMGDRLLHFSNSLVTLHEGMYGFGKNGCQKKKFNNFIAVYVPSNARYKGMLEPTYIITADGETDLWIYCFGYNVKKNYEDCKNLLREYIKKFADGAVCTDKFLMPYAGTENYTPQIVHASDHYNFVPFYQALRKAFGKKTTKGCAPLRVNPMEQIVRVKALYSRNPSSSHQKYSQFSNKKYDAIDLCIELNGDLDGCEHEYVYLLTNNECFMVSRYKNKKFLKKVAQNFNSHLKYPLSDQEIEDIVSTIMAQGRKNYGYAAWGIRLPLSELGSRARCCYDYKKLEKIAEYKSHNAKVKRHINKIHKEKRLERKVYVAALNHFNGKTYDISGFNINAIAKDLNISWATAKKYLERCLDAVIAELKDAFYSGDFPVLNDAAFSEDVVDITTGEILPATA